MKSSIKPRDSRLKGVCGCNIDRQCFVLKYTNMKCKLVEGNTSNLIVGFH